MGGIDREVGRIEGLAHVDQVVAGFRQQRRQLILGLRVAVGDIDVAP